MSMTPRVEPENSRSPRAHSTGAAGLRAGATLLMVLTALAVPLPRARCQSGALSAGTDSNRTSSSDSTYHLVSKHDVVMLVGAAVATAAAAPFDGTVQHAMRADDIHHGRGLQAAANGFAFLGGPGPFVGAAALYVVGRATQSNRVATLGVTLTEGVVLAATLNGLVKGFSGRELPNATTHDPGDFSFGRGFHDNNGPFVSFPSGHTAASFAAAAVIASTVQAWSPAASRVVSPAAYTTATLVAVSRLYQNVHWASDLPLGAAIGIWSGRTVVAWQGRHPENWLSRRLLDLQVAPSKRSLTITESISVTP